MAITALPTPPSRGDTPANFIAKSDAFIAALPVFVTEANAQAALLTLASTTNISTTSQAIATGSKTMTVSSGKSFVGGMYLVIADTAAPSTNSMFCQVTSYSGTTLVVNVISVLGSGTKTAWTISQSSAGGGTAMKGANSDITSLTGLTTPLSVAQGGFGANTHTLNSLLLGNGTSALLEVAPSTSGNVLTSNGTTWQSTTPVNNNIGIGQTWTDVSASRAVSTTYTNSTGKPISLSVQGTASATGMYIVFTIGGLAIASGTAGGTSSGFAGANIIIPVGATYSFAANTGSLTALKVFELR